jgi:hypothetical protein
MILPVNLLVVFLGKILDCGNISENDIPGRRKKRIVKRTGFADCRADMEFHELLVRTAV